MNLRDKKHLQMKIYFTNFWPGFNIYHNFFTYIFQKCGITYKITSENPDIIFFSRFGNYNLEQNIINNENIKFKKYQNAVLIFYSGENLRPLKSVDLNITYDITTKNNIRCPVWLFENYMKDLSNLKLTPKTNYKFCCFVYSNNISNRNKFCQELSKYKKIDCGGKCLNNIKYRVNDKIQFQTNYKFCIAYENESYPGYTTEKILDAYLSNCIPIYYGSSKTYLDFNPETYINAHDFKDNDDLIEYIKKIDQNDELYSTFMNKNILSSEWIYRINNNTFYKDLTDNIIKILKNKNYF